MTLDSERNTQKEFLFAEAFAVFIFQIVLCVFIIKTIEMPEEYDPPGFYVALTRVISGLVLQLILAREFHEGLLKMKFALNHEWKF